jgi:hypothetical protein
MRIPKVTGLIDTHDLGLIMRQGRDEEDDEND